MKFNKWTVGLAAVGAVSLASVAQAEEKASSVMTAVSSTTLSGYVDTSMNWNIGDGNGHTPAYAFNGSGKQDGFNLNSVKVSLEKPLDESEWAAGYKFDMFYGPDANALGTTGFGGQLATDFAIKQAYVNLRTPVGNGIDWKLGVFDSILGYESTETPSNPNFSRSYGYTLEPTTMTGLLGSYKVSELVNFSVGIANTTGPVVGGENLGAVAGGASIGRANPPKAESYKTYMASVALTAPNDWGFISGSSLYAGIINGWNGGIAAGAGGVQTSLYVGATINTPITGLRTGIAYDYFGHPAAGGPGLGGPQSWADSIALYASYQATEKLSIHARGEYMWESTVNGPIAGPDKVLALTATVQYDLWKNVISRLELRWDHQAGDQTGGGATASAGYYGTPLVPAGGGIAGGVSQPGASGKHDAFTLVANAIYKF